jgi:DNA-binding beta-propeller fold protein YncE
VTKDGVVCVTGAATGTVTIAWPSAAGYRSTTVPIGACPHDPCGDLSGEHVFVPCAGEASIVKVRLADATVVGKTGVGEGPSHLALHPGGTRLYSANSWDGTVTCLSTQGEVLGQAHSGGWAHALEVSPDGRSLYVANFLDDTLALFDAERLERVALVATEPYAHGLDVSPDGRYVLTSGFCSDAIRIHAGDGKQIARVPVGGGSSHAAFAANRAWVGCSVSDHLACVELDSLEAQDPLGVQVRDLRLVGVADR